MKIELVTWKIVGIRPLIQNRYNIPPDVEPVAPGDEDKPKPSRRKRYVPGPRFDEAKKQLYATSDGRFYHPGSAFWKAMLFAGEGRKFGSSAVPDIIARSVQTAEEEFILFNPKTLDDAPRPLTETEWMVDVRTAVNYNCKPPARIPVARPKWKHWGGLLVLEVDREFFKKLDALTDVLNIAGRFGIGAGRNRKEQRGRQMVWSGMNYGKFVAELKL